MSSSSPPPPSSSSSKSRNGGSQVSPAAANNAQAGSGPGHAIAATPSAPDPTPSDNSPSVLPHVNAPPIPADPASKSSPSTALIPPAPESHGGSSRQVTGATVAPKAESVRQRPSLTSDEEDKPSSHESVVPTFSAGLPGPQDDELFARRVVLGTFVIILVAGLIFGVIMFQRGKRRRLPRDAPPIHF